MVTDCNDREVKVGDPVGFAVGNCIKTGVVSEIKTRRGSTSEYARILLDKPEQTKIVWGAWDATTYQREVLSCEIKRFRNVSWNQCITLLKPLDNSEE
jgi:hypothetical protein